MGAISKHGILIVEYARQVQLHEGLDRRAAVEKAAKIRLRPILMTTLATGAGLVPLLLATGPGAEARFATSRVPAAGMFIGTLFTLFVLPAFYTVIASERQVERGYGVLSRSARPFHREHLQFPYTTLSSGLQLFLTADTETCC